MEQFMLQWLKNLIFALGILGLIAVFFIGIYFIGDLVFVMGSISSYNINIL